MSKKIKTRTPDQTITVWDCGCDCAACDQGHHCRNRDKDCHYGEEVEVPVSTKGHRLPRKGKKDHSSERMIPPPGRRIQDPLPPTEMYAYEVSGMIYNPEYDPPTMGPFQEFRQKVDATNERVATEAALTERAIFWRGSVGIGSNAFLIYDPEKRVHILSWGDSELSAKRFADSSEAKYCFPIEIKKIPYQE